MPGSSHPWPPVVWDKNEPYIFRNVPPGEHELKVELVNNDHTPMSPPIVQSVRFRSTGPTTLPNGGIMDVDSTGAQTAAAAIGLALMVAGIGMLRRARRAA